MAITITPDTAINGYYNHSIGLAQTETFDFSLETAADSSTHFVVDFALWNKVGMSALNPVSAEGDFPTTGYYILYPDDTNWHEMDLLPGTYDQKWINAYCRIRFLTSTTGEIELTWMATADANGWIRPALDFLNYRRLTHYRRDNPNPFDQSLPSPYNVSFVQEREFAVKMIQGDGYTSNDWGYYAQRVCNVPWNTIALNFDSHKFTLKRGGVVVSNLSDSNDTRVEFRADRRVTQTPETDYKVGLIRVEPGPDESGKFFLDTTKDFFYGEVSAGPALSQFAPFPEAHPTLGDFITPQALFANESGDTWLCEFDISSAILEPGCWYRIFVLIKVVVPDTNSPWHPYISEPIYVPDEGDPIQYDPTPSIKVYHHDDPAPSPSSCLNWGIPLERVWCQSQVTKATYEAALASAGILGAFDQNLVAVTAGLGNFLPAANLLPDIIEWLPVTETDSGTTYEAEILFRIPEFWKGFTRYAFIIWAFDHGGYLDYIVQPFEIHTTVADEVELYAGEWRRGGQEISAICEDAVQNDVVTLWMESTYSNYSPYILIVRNGALIGEYDATNSDNLEDLEELPVLEVRSSTPGNIEIEVDLAEAQLGEDDCVRVILKQDYSQGGSPSCPCVTMDIEATFAANAGGPGIHLVTVAGTITPDAGHSIVETWINIPPYYEEADASGSASIGGQFYINTGETNQGGIPLSITVQINTDDDCVYQQSGTMIAYDDDNYPIPDTETWDFDSCP